MISSRLSIDDLRDANLSEVFRLVEPESRFRDGTVVVAGTPVTL